MTSPQQKPYTMNHDVSQRTWDPEYLVKSNEEAEDAFYELDCIGMEKSNRGLQDALMHNVSPDVLAAINAQDVDIDDFDIDKIDFETLNNADISPFLGRDEFLQGQGVNQQVSQQSPEPHAPQGLLQQPYAPPHFVQQSYVQTQVQAPWVKQESPLHEQRTPGTQQQRVADHQSTTSRLSTPIPTERKGELQYPVPTHRAAPKAQRLTLAQPPVQAPRPIAAAAPQTMEITNFAQAQQAAATRPIHYNYIPPTNDTSFPKDPAAHKAYIRQLYDAFIDTTQCIDRATLPNFPTHWATLSTNPPTSPITPFQIATISHALLSIAIDLHTRGPICLNVYDRAKLKNAYKYRNLTFSERIAKLCELMRMSKARCGHLLKLDGLEMVVATAPLLCRQTASNYRHNRSRQDHLVEGSRIERRKRKAGEMGRGGSVVEEWE